LGEHVGEQHVVMPAQGIKGSSKRDEIAGYESTRVRANTEKMWDNSGRKKPHKTLKIRAEKMAVTVEILPR
jgi:hypothetical protein